MRQERVDNLNYALSKSEKENADFRSTITSLKAVVGDKGTMMADLQKNLRETTTKLATLTVKHEARVKECTKVTTDRDELRKKYDEEVTTNAKRAKQSQDDKIQRDQKIDELMTEMAKVNTRYKKLEQATTRQIKGLENDKKI